MNLFLQLSILQYHIRRRIGNFLDLLFQLTDMASEPYSVSGKHSDIPFGSDPVRPDVRSVLLPAGLTPSRSGVLHPDTSDIVLPAPRSPGCRPRRLLVFLKAPPVMEPPALSNSPSKVTILREYWNFLANAIAWSMLIHHHHLAQQILRISPSYCFSACTRVLARPITPGSFKAFSWLKLLFFLSHTGQRQKCRPAEFILL